MELNFYNSYFFHPLDIMGDSPDFPDPPDYFYGGAPFMPRPFFGRPPPFIYG